MAFIEWTQEKITNLASAINGEGEFGQSQSDSSVPDNRETAIVPL
jgi:hypothetical protein